MPRTKKVQVEEIEPEEPIVEQEVEQEPEPVEEVEEVECEEIEKEIVKPAKKNYKKTGTSRNKGENRTQAQKDAWAKCMEMKKKKQDEVRAQKAEDAKLLAEYKEHLKKKNEKAIVKKAIAIKKKSIMLEEELMSSEDEIPLEEVKEKIKTTRKKNIQPRVVKKEFPGENNPVEKFILHFI